MKLSQDDASAKVELSWLRHLHLIRLCVASSPRWEKCSHLVALSHQFLTLASCFLQDSESRHLR